VTEKVWSSKSVAPRYCENANAACLFYLMLTRSSHVSHSVCHIHSKQLPSAAEGTSCFITYHCFYPFTFFLLALSPFGTLLLQTASLHFSIMNSQTSSECYGQEHRTDLPISPISVVDSEKSIEANETDRRHSVQDKVVDVPPDGGYGWICVACIFLVNMHTWGINSVSRS
jgi:hypothetical protein